ncbi:MAG: hypothetical protein IPO92_16605 [Saprospiraceae bacterium]|nr:hypothetical protein [Saprospiraceae bacterium]
MKYIFIFIMLVGCPLSGYLQNISEPTKEGHSHKEKILKLNPVSDDFDPIHQRDYWQNRDQINTFKNADEGWSSLGPTEIKSSQGIDFYVSGRVRSIDYVHDSLIRIGSGSGGIWEYRKKMGQSSLKNISGGKVSSPWSGAMDTSPFDENLILYATGEPSYKVGTGMWRTTDGGVNWQNIPMPSQSFSYHELKFSKVRGRVWATGEDAYYSKNDGLTWSATKRLNITGLAVHPTQPDTAFIGQFGDCVYRTYNGGQNWQKLSIQHGLPSYSRGKIKLAISESNPKIVYAMYVNTNNPEESIYKTINGGNSWTRCIILDANGNEAGIGNALAPHSGYISVSPTNPDHVAIGAFWYAICDDGFTFNGPTSGSHVDYHAGEWSTDGSTIYFGTDGGVTYTRFDNILDLKFELTKIPTLQFVSIEGGKKNNNILIGGTQDNGLIYKVGNDPQWYFYLGDGGDVALDPIDENIYYASLGYFGGSLNFHNVRKSPTQLDGWFSTIAGIGPSTEWNRLLRTSKIGDINIIATQAHKELYYSIFKGDLWYEYNLPSFNAFSGIKSMEFTHEPIPRFIISSDNDEFGAILLVDFFKGEIDPISYGLPILRVVDRWDDFTYPKIYITPDNPKAVFAMMVGRGNHYDEYIFKTHLDTLEWKNISGNLEKLPYTCMLVHPHDENTIILGTDGYGIFRTENGGKDWFAWDDGIIRGALISDMDYQVINDSVYAVISTYGCGIYKRYLGGKKTTGTYNFKENTISGFISQQGWLIMSGLEQNKVIHAYDISGRLIAAHLENQVQGDGTIIYDASDWPNGIYFLHCSSRTLNKTVKLIKM